MSEKLLNHIARQPRACYIMRTKDGKTHYSGQWTISLEAILLVGEMVFK